MKILISYLTGLGNTILFIPTLRLLQQRFPEAIIDVLVRHEVSKDILKRINRCRHLYVFNSSTHPTLKGKLGFLYMLRRERYDVNITAFPANRTEFNLLSFLIGAKRRIAPRYQVGYMETLGFLQTDLVGSSVFCHDVKQNLSLLTRLGIDVSHAEDNLCWDLHPEEKTYAETWLQSVNVAPQDRLIGFHPGCNPSQGNIYKRWPAKYFARLGDRLTEEFGVKILILGSDDELSLNKDIFSFMEHKPLIPEPTTILNTAALIKQCTLFVSNDSGLMHTATAMRVPTVGLFGPSDPGRNAPYGKGHIIVRSNLACIPCNKYPHYQYGGSYVQCVYEREQKGYCMQSLSVDQVYETIVRNYAEILNPERT
ncbi:glycosyl transferase family 9 [Candidatus Vecturithrix granuli]|uniref:Glycosyl transferase family 9 n=1 Tax=Vecturithrix granuli TaxID=1499967 RepID=A0A081BZ88_VECG1|nr:glycosyl transferase family 9 [Candidatus Vecturithrix granuli]